MGEPIQCKIFNIVSTEGDKMVLLVPVNAPAFYIQTNGVDLPVDPIVAMTKVFEFLGMRFIDKLVEPPH